MVHTRTQDEFRTWGIPGRKPQIVYGTALMARIATEAVAAGRRPIGGVLFGTSGEIDTRILATRFIECTEEDHGGSPFTAAGELALERLAESFGSDLELVGLQPIGWYRSCYETPWPPRAHRLKFLIHADRT